MITLCRICKKEFNKKLDYKGTNIFIPSVCSAECFIAFLENEQIVTDIDDTKIEIFKEKEVNFRSSYEKKFAKWLKDNEIKYEYEQYIFTLSDSSRYVPDFYLPRYGIFIEVKGLWRGHAKRKFKFFKKDFGFPTYIVDLYFLRILNG